MKEIVSRQRELYNLMVETEKPLDDLHEKDVFSSTMKSLAFFLSIGLAIFFIPCFIFLINRAMPPLYVLLPAGLCAVAVIFLFSASFIPRMRIRMSSAYKDVNRARRDFWRELSQFTEETYGFSVYFKESDAPPCHFVQELQLYANSAKGVERIEVEIFDDRIIFFSGDKEIQPNAYNQDIAVPALDTKPLGWVEVIEAAKKNSTAQKHLETAKAPSGKIEELLNVNS